MDDKLVQPSCEKLTGPHHHPTDTMGDEGVNLEPNMMVDQHHVVDGVSTQKCMNITNVNGNLVYNVKVMDDVKNGMKDVEMKLTEQYENKLVVQK